MTYRLQSLPLGDRYRRAEMHFCRGVYSLAREEYEALLEGSFAHSPETQAKLRWRLAYCLAALGFSDEADRVVADALELPGLPDGVQARLESVRGFSALSRGDYDSARASCRRAVETLRGLRDHEGLAPALRWLALTHLRRGELDATFECAYCSLAEARHADLECEVGHAHGLLCVAFIQRGQYDAALEHGHEALETATRLGHQSGITRQNLHLSIAARLAGDLDLAASHALRALANAEEADAPNLVVSCRLAASRALRESGRLDAARELAEGALRIAQNSERERDHVLVLEDLGDLDVAAGNVQAGLKKYRAAFRAAEAIAPEGDLVAELGWRIGAAILATGKSGDALPWIEKSLAVCDKSQERKEKALALRARGLWYAHAGREADAKSDLEESLSTLEALSVPYERAWTHLAIDTALGECSSDSAAVRSERRQHLAAARRLFDRIGSLHGLKATENAEIRLVTEESGTAASAVERAALTRGVRVFTTDWPSPAFRETLDECRKLGPTSLPLLLLGKTGTGKTLLAEALHHLGRREEGDFHPVNCAALPEHLQESELYGHRKGAFTGAEREHPGIFREAGRGTVFLDEIDKTSLEFQAKLLHVLDNREIRPVGSTRRVAVEARIICATNRDLFALVERGTFLEDLHHRLICGVIEVPPLKDRLEDLRLLTRYLLEEVCALEGTPVPVITEDAWRILTAHDWPGNVRELKSLLHRAVALHRGLPRLGAKEIVSSAPLGSTLKGRSAGPGRGAGLVKRLEHAEREEILRALEKAGGVRRKAAEILGISYRGLGKKMVRLGIAGLPGEKSESR